MKVIVLGDCLSSSPSWADCISKKLNCTLVNFSSTYSTNETQIFSLQDYLFENNLDFEDIIIWQLSKTYNTKMGPSLEEAVSNPSRYYCYLSNQLKNQEVDFSMSSEDQLKEIMSLLTTARKWTDRILVFRGWREIISSEETKLMATQLRNNRIEFLSETLIDWSYENNFFFNTNGVPSYETQCKFCDKLIIPKFNLMKWI